MQFTHNMINVSAKPFARIAVLVHDSLLAETVFVHMQKNGFHVDVYYGFEDLQENIRNYQTCPEFLIFDMDFFDFKIFRNLPEMRDTKLIAISNKHDMDSRLRAVRANVSYFEIKPVNIERLAEQINESLVITERRLYSVLVIDSCISDLKTYRCRLESQGIRVRFVQNPLNTLKELQRYKFDLVLIADNLSEANGLDIFKVIRQVYSPSELPVVLATETQDPDVLSEICRETNFEPIHKSLCRDGFLTRILDVLK